MSDSACRAFALVLGMRLAALSGMISRRLLDLFSLASAVAVTRFAFRSHNLYDVDSVNFALGMARFDPRVHQPHPPGYFLYVWLGRLLNLPLHNANLALVLLSILASCGTVIVIYLLASEWFGEDAARFAGALFLLSPLAWFHGIVALTYIVEAFFSALIGFLCWRLYRGRTDLVLATAIVLGISAGVRPTSLLFLGPLFVFSLRNAPGRRVAGIVVLLATLMAWIFPMVAASGGLSVYVGALISLMGIIPAKTTVFNSSPANSIARAFTIFFIYLLAFGAASIAPIGAKYRTGMDDPGKKTFTLVWIGPALCFFTFIFLQFVNSGYLLLVMAPACVWLGHWAALWYRNAGWRKSAKMALIGGFAAVNILIFLDSPLYCSYRSVREFDVSLEAVRRALPQVASPQRTLLIGFDSHFLGYRHAGYYLPDYYTVEYPEVRLREGVRVFAMQGRNTRLLPVLSTSQYSRFVLFPLPQGDASYKEYLQTVRKKLPAAGLQTIHLAGFDFVTGPISDLPLLFPKALALAPGVSGPSLSTAACKQPCTPAAPTSAIRP